MKSIIKTLMVTNYKLIKWLLQIAFTIFLFYFTIQQIEVERLREILREIKLLPLLGIPVLLFVNMVVSGYRIFALYRFYGIKANLVHVCMTRFQGFFFALLFPLLGDAYKVQTFKTRYGSTYGKNSFVLLVDKIIYIFALTIIIAPVWIFGIIDIDIIFQIAIVALLLLEVIVLYLVNKPRIIELILRRFKILHKKLESFQIKFVARKNFYREVSKNTLVALGRHGLIALTYLLIAYTVIHDINFNIILFIFIVFSVMLAKIIPVSVGGIGLREYIAVMLFPQAGVETEYAFTVAFLISSVVIIQGILGGISFMAGRLFKINKKVID